MIVKQDTPTSDTGPVMALPEDTEPEQAAGQADFGPTWPEAAKKNPIWRRLWLKKNPGKSKFRRESAAGKHSDKLRREEDPLSPKETKPGNKTAPGDKSGRKPLAGAGDKRADDLTSADLPADAPESAVMESSPSDPGTVEPDSPEAVNPASADLAPEGREPGAHASDVTDPGSTGQGASEPVNDGDPATYDHAPTGSDTLEPASTGAPTGSDTPALDQAAPDSDKPGKAEIKQMRKLKKSKARMEKTGSKLEVAKKNLAQQKPHKPPGAIDDVSRAARHELWLKAHGKIHDIERDNVGVETAHRTEMIAERAIHAGSHFMKKRIRTRPARQVGHWEQKYRQASANYRFRQAATENPELKSNPLSRYLQKRRLKQFQKQTETAAREIAIKTGVKTLTATDKALRAVLFFAKKNPSVIAIVLATLLLVLLLQSCIGSAVTIGQGLTGAIGGTSFLAADEEIDEAELRYTEWETDLTLQAKNAAATHSGYNEYRYSIAATGHDPFAMLAYLTAKYDNFTYAAIQGELIALFQQQYTLTFTRIVELRSYTVRVSTPGGGSSTRTVYYNYYILQTTLTARPFEDVITPLLVTQDEQDRYAAYMFLHGNRQYVGNPLSFVWLSRVSSYYGYRVHPVIGEKDYHTGVDIAVPQGTEILAGGVGLVLESGVNGGYGLTLLVDYGNGITARYAHCSALYVAVGQTVNRGEVIALSGNTGTSTGPHLHIEVIKNGRFLNPLYFVEGTIG